MSIRPRNGLWVLVGALLAGHLEAAEEAPPVELGLRIGEHAPNFVLNDQNDHEVSLESLLKKGPVALVFYRSADWCLACQFELKNFQRYLKDFEAAGGQVVGVSYDSTKALKKFADGQNIAFPLLSDPDTKTIDAYRMRDRGSSEQPGFAGHASFVVDQTGVIRAKFESVLYQAQPGMDILLKGIREARKPQTSTAKAGMMPASNAARNAAEACPFCGSHLPAVPHNAKTSPQGTPQRGNPET
jgi:peroxiredoxin